MCKKINYLVSFLFVLTLAVSLSAQGVDPGTDNLAHKWTFEDGTANDMVGEAHGTLMEGAVVTEGDLVLATAGDYVELSGETIALMFYDEITLEVWFTSVSGGNIDYHMIMFFGDANDLGFGSNSYFISPARGDDVCRTAISIGDLETPWASESGANGPELDDGILHHVVSTIDAANISLYIDGELMETIELSETNAIWGISAQMAAIGKGGYANDPTWLGNVHEAAIYSRALTADEVLFLASQSPLSPSAVDNQPSVVADFSLSQNYPNPFNPVTEISYNIAERGDVNLTVYNMLGQEVATLVNATQEAGTHSVTFNAADLTSGVYFYKLVSNGNVEMKKMVLTK